MYGKERCFFKQIQFAIFSSYSGYAEIARLFLHTCFSFPSDLLQYGDR